MARRASFTHPSRALVATLLLTGCASAGPEIAPDPTARQRRGETTLLEVTAPVAAKRAQAHTSDPVASDDSGTARPGRILVYSAITGHTPLGQGPTPGRADRFRSPAEREQARAAELEREIREEVERQEEIIVDEQPNTLVPPPPPPGPDQGGSPLEAPPAPRDRDLPDSVFDIDRVTIPSGHWDNDTDLLLVRRSLDVDRDGKPEEVRFVDPISDEPIRIEADRNYDGRIDTWQTYEDGVLVVRVRDTDADGKSDTWERYKDGRMNAQTLDADHDGVKDTFLRYEGGELVEKLEDSNNDGTIDRMVTFENLHRVQTEEDRTLNGWTDTWIRYRVVGGREVVARVERDSKDHGKADVFETYETVGGETRLVRREEDLNGDGAIDVVSVYENGKLVRRAISDEALAPL